MPSITIGNGITTNIVMPDGFLYWFVTGVLVKKSNQIPGVPPSIIFNEATENSIALEVDITSPGTAKTLDIEFSTAADSGFEVLASYEVNNVQTASYTIANLAKGVPYYFRARYSNDAGYGNYTAVQTQWTALDAPTTLALLSGGSGFEWVDNATGDSVEIQISSVSDVAEFSTVATVAAGAQTWANPDWSTYGARWARVRSNNGAGKMSSWSNVLGYDYEG